MHCKLFITLIAVLMYFFPFSASAQKTVFVSILPQKFFVQQISGNLLNIEVMVQPGASPATYEPKPSQMRKLAASSMYFAIGVPFEKAWLSKIAQINEDMVIIHTDAGITKTAMTEENELIGEHHDVEIDHSSHDHSGLDPHIWLSPVLVKKQADTIRKALIELLPEKIATLNANYSNFSDKIDSLHHELQTLLNDKKGMHFMVFHPSWGYFAREYGLEQISVEIEGKSPKPAQMQELINLAKVNNIQIIFAQKQFSSKSAEIIAREIGGKVIQIDPLAEDWFTNMENVARQINSAVK